MASRGRVGKQLLVVLSVGLSAGRRPAAIFLDEMWRLRGAAAFGLRPQHPESEQRIESSGRCATPTIFRASFDIKGNADDGQSAVLPCSETY